MYLTVKGFSTTTDLSIRMRGGRGVGFGVGEGVGLGVITGAGVGAGCEGVSSDSHFVSILNNNPTMADSVTAI